MGSSVAVQVGSPEKPVTVKVTGVPATLGVPEPAGDSVLGVSAPEVQDRLTVTLAVLLSLNCFLTWKVSLLRVLVMVQEALPFGVSATGTVQPLAV